MKFDNEQLLKYIGACTSPYHTVDTSLQMLLDSGFTELNLDDEWQLDSGSYVVNVFGTTLFAFHIGKNQKIHYVLPRRIRIFLRSVLNPILLPL